MKPAPFEYIAPQSVEQALQLKSTFGTSAHWLAGGQSLIPSLNFRCLRPEQVIDLNGLRELRDVYLDNEGILHIGAMLRYCELEQHALIQAHLPIMQYAIPYIAHQAIRSRGTIGGSLSYADPAAEMPTVTTALGARFRLISQSGERWVKAEDFFLGRFQTDTRPDELLAEVAIPAATAATAWGFIERSRRHGDRVLMGVAVVLSMTADARCTEARLVYQNGAPTPLWARRASALLAEGDMDSDRIDAVARMAAFEEIDPETDVHASSEYRRHLAYELTKRAVAEALRRGKEEAGHE